MKIEEAISLYNKERQDRELKAALYLIKNKNEAIKRLDDFIKSHIYDLLKAPQTFYWFSVSTSDFPHYDIHTHIQDQYPEFTLSFNRYMQSIDIKLADKDWDWKGYGIKDEEHEIELKTKTSKFKRIFKKLFR